MSGNFLKRLTGSHQAPPPYCQDTEPVEYCCTDNSCYEWFNTNEATCRGQADKDNGILCEGGPTLRCFCD